MVLIRQIFKTRLAHMCVQIKTLLPFTSSLLQWFNKKCHPSKKDEAANVAVRLGNTLKNQYNIWVIIFLN
jgi:hypothetical protein